jgi:chromosome segregation ATPase
MPAPDDDPVWSLEALRAHTEALIAGVDAKHDTRAAAEDKHRDRLLDELRAADARAMQQFAAMRAELTAANDRVAAQLTALADRINRAEGSIAGAKESKAGLYTLIATIGVVITIVVVIANILNGGNGSV